MADEGKLRLQAQRGDRARAICEDELFIEAFDAIEKRIEEGWKETQASEKQERENAYLMHRLVQNFRAHFRSLMTTGEQAKKDLLDINDPSRLRRIINGR